MLNFFTLVFLVAFVAAIVFLRKSSKAKKSGEDNTQLKKNGLIAVAIAVIAFVVVGTMAPDPVDDEPVTDSVAEEEPSEEENEKEDSKVITIDAGEVGDYGQELVLNENTDMPENIIGYFVPNGKYEVANKGDNPTQVNVYKNEKT